MNIKQTYRQIFLIAAVVFSFQQALQAQKPVRSAPLLPLYFDKGKILYTPDSLGNRIPDFSYCGYKASEQAIPDVEVKIVVPVIKGDATLRIQSALDYVASLPLDANGFRGTVLLQKGTYEVLGQLRINASGVVLRGSGMNANGTTIIGAGTGRLALIKIIGTGPTFVCCSHNLPRNYYAAKGLQWAASIQGTKVSHKIFWLNMLLMIRNHQTSARHLLLPLWATILPN